ncbi:hypothetical protein [Protofrankia symbiont of Coriaria ruscifolia]|nr:hypothetical protein [Protofrankia symbiont of Coriaria ruscifolia]
MVVGQAQAKLLVDLGLVFRVGLVEDGEESSEGIDQIFDLLASHAASG